MKAEVTGRENDNKSIVLFLIAGIVKLMQDLLAKKQKKKKIQWKWKQMFAMILSFISVFN